MGPGKKSALLCAFLPYALIGISAAYPRALSRQTAGLFRFQETRNLWSIYRGAMVTNDQILSQDDVDALLAGAAEGESAEEKPVSAKEPERRTVAANVMRSESEVREILAQLCRSAFVQRDKGVSVIWNASGLFPLTSGYSMEIQGKKYVSLGPFGDEHLVIGSRE